MCLAQGHNAVTTVKLEPAIPRSRYKHSTTKPLRLQMPTVGLYEYMCIMSNEVIQENNFEEGIQRIQEYVCNTQIKL